MVVIFLIHRHLSRPTSSKTLLYLLMWLRGRNHLFEGPLENEFLLPVLLLSLCSMSARQSLLAPQSIKQEPRSSSHPYKIIGTYNSVSFPSFIHSFIGRIQPSRPAIRPLSRHPRRRQRPTSEAGRGDSESRVLLEAFVADRPAGALPDHAAVFQARFDAPEGGARSECGGGSM